jgi:signal transduction histidine kinase
MAAIDISMQRQSSPGKTNVIVGILEHIATFLSYPGVKIMTLVMALCDFKHRAIAPFASKIAGDGGLVRETTMSAEHSGNLLWQRVRILEWLVLGSGLLLQVLAMLPPSVAPGDPGIGLPVPPDSPALGIVSLLAIGLVACLLWLEKPKLSERARGFLLMAEVTLIGVAAIFAFPRFLALLTFTAVIKSLIKLKSPVWICVVVANAIAAMATIVYVHSQFLSGAGPTPPPVGPLPMAAVIWLSAIFDTGLAGLFCCLIVGERRAHEESERLLEQVEELTLKCERQRIGREIHDGLGHRIVSITLQLDVATKLFERDPNKALAAITLARLVADKSLTELREAVSAVRDVEFSLVKNLQQISAEVEQDSDIQMVLDIDEQLPELLPANINRELFAITKECINNARKHARATRIDVMFKRQVNGLKLSVGDNGVGIDKRRPEGYGMTSLRERAINCQGQLTIESRRDHGTLVTVLIAAERCA